MKNDGWKLEDDPFLLGFGNFSGVNSLLNFGRGTLDIPKSTKYLVRIGFWNP